MPVKPRLRNLRSLQQTRERLLRQRSIPLPYQETDPRSLWDNYEPGKEITPSNLVQDAVESASPDPIEAISNFGDRLRRYLTRGPDINQRVPRTTRRYIAKI